MLKWVCVGDVLCLCTSELRVHNVYPDFVSIEISPTKAAVSSTKEACEEANKRAKEKSDEKWREVLREHLNKAGEEAAVVAAVASREHDALLEETQEAFRM